MDADGYGDNHCNTDNAEESNSKGNTFFITKVKKSLRLQLVNIFTDFF